MHKTITGLAAVMLSLASAASEIPTVRLGLSDGEVATSSTLGNNNGARSIEAAAVLPADLLASYEDLEAVGVNVGLASRLNVDGISVWIRESLEGPSIFEAELTKEDGIVKGWNTVTGTACPLERGKDLYIGYTLGLAGASFPVSAVGESRENGLFVNLEGEWTDMSDAGFGVLSVELIATASNLVPYDLALRKVDLPQSIKIGNTVPMRLKVYNAGVNSVAGFTVACDVEGYERIAIEVDRPVSPYEVADVEIEFRSPVDRKSQSVPMTVTITELADGEDADMSDNSLETSFSMRRFDFEKAMLLEDFSTEKCSICPRAADVLHNLLAEQDFQNRIFAVAHHAGFGTDWLTVPASNTYLWFYDGGVGNTYAPAFMYDRYSFDGSSPVNNATEDYAEIKRKVMERLAQTPMTALEATSSFDEESSTLRVHVAGEKREGYSGDRLTVCIVEDNIKARKQAGTSDTFIHQHVLRDVNEVWGATVSWDDQDEFSFDHDFYIQPTWVKDNLQVIAFISSYDQTNYKNCPVDNAVLLPEIDWKTNDVASPSVCGKDADTEYYTLQGLRVSAPSAGLYIVRRGERVTKEYIR